MTARDDKHNEDGGPYIPPVIYDAKRGGFYDTKDHHRLTDAELAEYRKNNPPQPITRQIDEHTALLLAAISAASIQNTRDTAKQRIGKDSPYWTQAYEDVCTAVEREMRERERAEAAETTRSHEQQNAAPAGEIARKQDGVLAHRSTPPAGAAPSTTPRRTVTQAEIDSASKHCESPASEAIDLTIKLLRETARRHPVILQDTDIKAFILNELNPAKVMANKDRTSCYGLMGLLAKARAETASALSAIRQTAQEDEAHFILNGYERKWRSYSHFNGSVVSYEDVVEWSGIDSDRERIRERVYTVTYAMLNGSGKRGGTLAAGESVPFESGMVFNVTRTTNA